MVKPSVVYHFDFGSPNCYLLHKTIPALEQRTGVTVDYLPILLGGLMKLTNNQPPMLSFGGVKGKLDYMNVEMARFVRDHGIAQFNFNPHFPINTLRLMRGAVAAQQLGCFVDYIDVCFNAMWATPVNMGDSDVFQSTVAEAGLPHSELISLMESPEIKQQLLDNTERSASQGNFGAPTVFVGDEMFFGKENLLLIEEEISRQTI